MSDAEQPQPDANPFETPTKEHEMIQATAGVWDVECDYLFDAANPMSTKGTETVETIGPFWAVSRFETRMGEMPYTGSATVGYDTRERCWVSTWIGCTDPYLWSFKGQWDDAEKTLTMRGRGPVPMSEHSGEYVTVERYLSEDERTFEMSLLLPDGNAIKMFEYRYERRS